MKSIEIKICSYIFVTPKPFHLVACLVSCMYGMFFWLFLEMDLEASSYCCLSLAHLAIGQHPGPQRNQAHFYCRPSTHLPSPPPVPRLEQSVLLMKHVHFARPSFTMGSLVVTPAMRRGGALLCVHLPHLESNR